MGYEIRRRYIAYYYPGFHPTEEMDRRKFKGWTEWEMIKNASPLYEGHYQPRIPLWGYENEALPEVMEKKIDTACQYGLSVFHFVWYWYCQQPFMAEALEDGFLRAVNNNTMKFSILWANHDRYDGFPEECTGQPQLLYTTDYSLQSLNKLFDYWIKHYFTHPSYWRLPDGRLFISIHLVSELIERAGGIEGCRRSLVSLRQRVREAGLGEIHINTTQGYYFNDLQLLPSLGFDSVTNYCVLGYCEGQHDPHFQKLHLPDHRHLTHIPYVGRTQNVIKTWYYVREQAKLPYFPVINVGRDSTPRVRGPVDPNYKGRYGYRPVLDDARPEYFMEELVAADEFLKAVQEVEYPFVFINSWNEWTNGAYLEPDTIFAYGHLEMVKKFACAAVFAEPNFIHLQTRED